MKPAKKLAVMSGLLASLLATPAAIAGELDGTWTVVSAKVGDAPLKDLKGSQLIIKDKQAIMKDKRGEQKFTLKLSRDKDPKQMDLQPPGKQEPATLGVYKVSGDKLVICLAGQDVVEENGKRTVKQGKRPTKLDDPAALQLQFERTKAK